MIFSFDNKKLEKLPSDSFIGIKRAIFLRNGQMNPIVTF